VNINLKNLEEHLFPHSHGKAILISIIIAMAIFSFFAVFKFHDFLDLSLMSRLKGQLFTFGSSDFEMDIVNEATISNGYLNIPVKITGDIPTTQKITDIWIGFSNIPAYLIKASTSVSADLSPNAVTSVSGLPEELSGGEYNMQATGLDLSGDFTTLTDYMTIRLQVDTTQTITAGTFNVSYINVFTSGPQYDNYDGQVITIIPSVPPTAPVGFKTTQVTANSIGVDWTTATGVTGYSIFKDDVLVGSLDGSATSYSYAGLEINKSYSLAIEAVNQYGIHSSKTTITASTGNSFSLGTIALSGTSLETDKFFAILNSQVAAQMNVNLGTYTPADFEYKFTWSCLSPSSSCPAALVHPTSGYQASSSDILTVAITDWKNTNWSVKADVHNKTTNEILVSSNKNFSFVNPLPVVTLSSVTSSQSNTGATLTSILNIAENDSVAVALNYSDDANDGQIIETSKSSDFVGSVTYAPSISTKVGTIILNFPVGNGDVTSGTNTKNISFNVKDSDGAIVPVVLKFKVLNKNNAPTISAQTKTWDVNLTDPTYVQPVQFIDANDLDLIYPDVGEELTFDWAVPLQAELQGLSIDNALGTNTQTGIKWATGKPTFAQKGTYSVQIKVTDKAGLSNQATMTFVINSGNVPPTLRTEQMTADHTGQEDMPITIVADPKVVGDDPDGDNNTLRWEINYGSISSQDIISIDTAKTKVVGDTFTFTPNPNKNNTVKIPVEVKLFDTAGTFVSYTFNLNWTSVNDAPEIKVNLNDFIKPSLSEDLKTILTFNDAMVLDPDNVFSDLTWSYTTADYPAAISSTVNINKYQIEVSPTKDANGPVKLTLGVSDGFLSDSATLDLTWAFVPDSPEWISWPGKNGIDTAYIGENYIFNLTNAIYDPDTVMSLNRAQGAYQSALSVTFEGTSLPSAATIAKNNSGEYILTWIPLVTQENMSYTFNVTAIDGTLFRVSKDFQMQVKDGAGLKITSVTPINSTSLQVLMSGLVKSISVIKDNFALNLSGGMGSIAVSGVTLGADEKTITVTTGQMASNTAYDLIVKNLVSKDGLYTIPSAGINKTFTSTTTATNSSGDCNGDTFGKYNDPLLALEYAIGKYPEMRSTVIGNCDLNSPSSSGTINVNDALAVYQLYVSQQ